MRLYAIHRRDDASETIAQRFGVQPERSVYRLSQSRIYTRRWRIGVFVGVEFNDSFIAELFSRNVARHRRDIRPEITRHEVDCIRAPDLIQISKTASQAELGNNFPLRHFCTRLRCFVQKYRRVNYAAKKALSQTC